MKFYFVRHGESTANILMEFSNNASTHPLTDRGVEQARALGNSLVGVGFARIYTSPVLRAAQTARILAEMLGAPLEFTEALREWSVGVYEGTRGPLGWEQHRRVQEDWFIHRRGFPHTTPTIAEPLPGAPLRLRCLSWCGQPPPTEPSTW